MNQSMLNSAVPAAIVRKLRLVQKRSMLVQVACALVAAVAVLLAAMGIAMLIDWLATLYDSRWRLVLTTLAISVAACTSIGWIVVAWRRAQRLERVAAEVDRQEPRLEERWTTMTRLGDDAVKPEVVHPAMLRRLSSEAASWEPRIEPDQVVSLSTLMRALIGLTAVTAVLAIAVVLDSREVSVLARRFWLPGSSISATKLVDVPGNVVIARGEPLALNATIDGRQVTNAILFLQPEAKPAQSISLVAERSTPVGFTHRMRSVDEPFTYRFRAGDGQTEWFNVDVADRPEIEAIKLTVTPPAYTKQQPKTFEKLPERLSALRNSRVELAIRAKAPVKTAQLKMDNNQVANLSLDADGWYRWTTSLAESSSVTPVLTEQHGLTNRRQPKCQLIAYEDQPPVVKVLTPNDRVAVRPDDAIQITFSATDDVGIGAAELVVYQEGDQKEPKELAAIPIDLGEQQGARAVQQTVDLDLKKFAAKNGAELSYEIRVREDRGTDQPRIASRPPANKKDAKQQKPLASSDMSKNKVANQQQGSKTSTAASNASPATADATQQASTASETQSSQSDGSQSATPQNKANQTASSASPSPQPTGAKPDTKAMAANDTPQTAQSSASDAKQPSPSSAQAAEKSNAQPAGTNAPANEKNLAAAKSDPQSAKAGEMKNAADSQQPRTAASGQQSVAENAKPGGEQSAATQQASTASPSNASNPKDSAAAMKKQTANPTNSPTNSATQTAKMEKPADAKSQAKNPTEPPAARTASSGRQSLNANSDPAAAEQSAKTEQANASQDSNSSTANNAASMKKDQAADQKPSASSTAQAKKSDSQPGDSKSEKSMAAASQTQSPSGKQTKSDDSPKTASSDSTPPPGDNMTRRSLDVAQSGSSQRMRLKVDQWAGSFEGQQRAKLEMAIDPELEALDQKLAKAQRTVRGVLDGLEADRSWLAAYDRDLATTQQLVTEGKGIIDKLVAQSKDTPYAFIGLQVADLGVAHLEPARNSFWSAIQSKGDDRTGSVRDGWQHLGRARQLLADLRGQFERSRRDFQLAEAVERAKKMYQVYVEHSQALLDVHDSDPDRYNRKMAEFELDEEYLKRLKEVLKMRQELQAELARILGDDPRLLRRYMDNMRAKSNNLREQLADLSAKQDGLNREVRAWAAFAEADRPPMAKLLLLQNLQEAAKIATSAGELQDRYQSWLPLQKESKDSTLVSVSKQIQEAATAAGELKSRAANYVAAEQNTAVAPSAQPPAPTAEAPAETAKPPVVADNGQALDQVIAQSETLYGQLGQLEVSLRQLASREDNVEVATFAGNRLTQTRQLIADSSAWIRQIKAHKAGSYTGAAEVTQYRLAMKTDELAGKLGDLEQQLAGMLQRTDQSLPEPIAAKSRELMAALDKEAAPNQLAAVYALHSNQLPRSTERQGLAGAALAKAEKLYDELARLAITEMDKLPVQDPIASLLEDPTLDELLAQLEQELPLQELLGIPNRPSNLRIIGDWMRPGSGGGGGSSGMRRMAANQMKQNDKRSQQKLNQAYQKAIARALKETTPKRTEKVAKSTKLSDWNKLVSHLGDDLRQGRDKAPPEQYRQAIEQYFAQISRAVAEQEKKSP